MSSPFEQTLEKLLSQLKVRHLRVVVALDEFRSATAAAKALHVSGAAISKTLAEVEELLGMRLFDRGRYKMRPTEAGLCAIEESKLVLAQLERMSEVLTKLGLGVAGKLHVASSTASAQPLVAEALAEFAQRYPGVDIRFTMESTVDDMLADLMEGEIDLLFSYADRRFEKPGMATQLVLPPQKLFIVASKGHPLVGARVPLTLAALHDSLWCVPAEWSRLRHHLEALFRQGNLDMPHRGFNTSDLTMILNLLKTTDCLTIMPERVASQVAQDSLAVILPYTVAGHAERVDMIWYHHIQPRAAAKLFKDLVQQLQQAY